MYMKKLLSVFMSLVMCIGFVYVPAAAKTADDDDPVVGIAWRADTDSEFYTNICAALDEAGLEHVLLPQVKSPDLKYNKDGKVIKGILKTGALSRASGKMVRCNSWQGSNAAKAVSGVDAVIFTGGEDISPSLFYKQVKWHGIEEEIDYCAERDVSDYLTMSYCLDKDIPIMGFCRGMQMLCVVSGGEVIQDIPTYFKDKGIDYSYIHRNQKAKPEDYRDYSAHDVKVEKDSILYRMVRRTTLKGCPSWHHQAVENVDNTRLKVTGTTDTQGISMIEAVERTDKSFALGLQFHPEAAVAKYANKAANSGDFMSRSTAMSVFEYFEDYLEND